MAPRAQIGYLVGYVASNVFKIWVPEDRSVIHARDVEFDENAFFNPLEPVRIVRFREPIEEEDLRTPEILSRAPIDEESDDDILDGIRTPGSQEEEPQGPPARSQQDGESQAEPISKLTLTNSLMLIRV